MGEPGRFQALLRWWRDLPAGWRVNVGLYALTGVSLAALLSQVVAGGGSRPQRIEVATQATTPTTPTTLNTTTIDQATTTTPTALPATSAPPPSPGPAPKTATTAKGKAATGTGGSPPPATFNPTTAPPVRCERNATDPACGPFSWDPPPGDNAGLSIELVSMSPEAPSPGEVVTFRFRVADPDHLVTGNCSRLTFDNGGGSASGPPCNPPDCPDAHGVWDTPPKEPRSNEITFHHTFPSAGEYTGTATFRTDLDRCPDPYGSEGTKTVGVTVGE